MNRKGPWRRVHTPSRLPLRTHRKRDVWVRGRWAPYLLIMATTMPPITIIVHCNTSVKKTAVRPPTKKCLRYLQAWEVLRSRRCRYLTLLNILCCHFAVSRPSRLSEFYPKRGPKLQGLTFPIDRENSQ